MLDLNEALTRLAKPFFDQKAEKLYVVKHCSRIYVGIYPAKNCRVCGEKPDCLELLAMEQVPSIAEKLV